MEITIEIPIKSYLKKYIEVSFGENIKLSERTWIGIIIYNVIKRKTFKNNYDYKPVSEDINAQMQFKISSDTSYRYGCILLPTQIYYINSALDGLFKGEIVKQALINQNNYGIDFKTSILTILDAYDITEDELNYESIRKYFNRNYQKYKNRLIF